MHISDLSRLHQVQVGPSAVRLHDYSKAIIPTNGQATLHCARRGKSYKVVVQVITAQRYYSPFLDLTDSTRMGILNYDVDTVHQLEAAPTSALPPLG